MKKSLLILLTATFVLEIGLRLFLGLGDTVLMQESKQYEYIAQPSQDRTRFGNHIYYNAHSMRSKEVDTSQNIILGLGDSVLNGGVLTEQDSLATELLSQKLSIFFREPVQFLNISAGSWGPDNNYAYLQEHGHFSAKKIYLVVSSHDAYDTMDFQPIVGIDKSFPNSQYPLALWELLDRYVLPRLFKNNNPEKQEINKKEKLGEFNPGFVNLIAYSRKHQIPLVVYLHPEQAEISAGSYNAQGQEILQLLQGEGIPVIQALEQGISPGHFRDQIHLNEKGQRFMANLIFQFETQSELVKL